MEQPTFYNCSICGNGHWSNEPGCPQTVTLTVPAAPEVAMAWDKRHFCGVCPRQLQPAHGFNVVEFAEHQAAHVRTALAMAAIDATRYRAELKMIDGVLKNPMTQAWPVDSLRQVVQHHVDVAIKDD